MDQRTIMALGQSSHVISLPKTWLKTNNLKQGDRVSLNVQRDGSLVLYPSANVTEEVRKIHLNVGIDESANSIIRRIISAYLDGYIMIRLTSEKIFSINQQRAIRQIVSTLYMMIIESEASSIVLETLIDESKASVSSGINRMHIIVSSMCRDILLSLKNWDENLVRSVVSLENDVDQLLYLLLRLIRSSAVNPSLADRQDLDVLDCLDYQTLVHRIEHVADHATNIANSILALIESKLDLPKRIIVTLTNTAELAFSSYNEAVQSYLVKDIKPTNEIIDKQNEIEKINREITTLLPFGEPYEASILSHLISIMDSIMRISKDSADIAELTIDRAYKFVNAKS